MSEATLTAVRLEGPLGIICGGGSLPFAVADAAIKSGRRVVLVGLLGFADAERIVAYPHHWLAVGQAGRLFRLLKHEGCRDLVFVGNLVRPTIRQLRLDFTMLR